VSSPSEPLTSDASLSESDSPGMLRMNVNACMLKDYDANTTLNTTHHKLKAKLVEKAKSSRSSITHMICIVTTG